MTNPDDAFPDETPWVERLESDAQAFLALYDLYFPRVYNYVRYRLGDPAAADDLTAQVFERALEKRETYRPERSPFGAWLFGIARNLVNYHLRTLRSHPAVPFEALRELPASQPSPEEALIQMEGRRELLAVLETFGERERDLLSLKFAARLSNRRIAELTGLSESNVGVILFRTVARLRAALAPSIE